MGPAAATVATATGPAPRHLQVAPVLEPGVVHFPAERQSGIIAGRIGTVPLPAHPRLLAVGEVDRVHVPDRVRLAVLAGGLKAVVVGLVLGVAPL
jgi:hypothetical protein